MRTLLKALVLGWACLSSVAMAAEDPRGKFIKTDGKQPDERVKITPRSCVWFAEEAKLIVTAYMEGTLRSMTA